MKKITSFFFLIILLICISTIASAQSFTCPSINLQPIDPIIGQCLPIPVKAQLSEGNFKILDIKWTLPLSPHSSLSNTTSLTANLIGISEGYDEYKLVLKTISNQNLIINGDFELGYSNFTSNYSYKSGIGGNVLYDAGTFTVANNPNSVHHAFPNMGDHTSGAGKMLIVNGAEEANVKVWSQTIQGVKPHTKYAFSAFLASCSPDNLPILSFSINGRQEGSSLTGGIVGRWNQFYTEWDSGELSGNITLDIINQQLGNGGNDFALDDLSFAELCETTSTLKVTIEGLPTLTINTPDAICSLGTADLTAPTISTKGNSTDILTYYSDAAATSLLVNPTRVIAGTYYIKSTTLQGCSIIKPVTVNITPKPLPITATENINFGTSYFWQVNGQTYTKTGIYSKTNDVCTADQILELIVNAAPLVCNGELQVILDDNFGTGTSDRGPKPLDFTTTYNYTASGGIGQNGYSVMKNAKQGNNAWSAGGDHTSGKNGNGYMLIFDANTTLGSIFYEKKYSGLCSGSLCTFSIYAANLVPSSYANFTVKPMVKIDLINPLTGVILKSMLSSELQLSTDDELLWKELSLSFNIPAGLDTIIVRVSNGQADTNGNGNDVAFDDVSFSICVPAVTISLSDEKICVGTSAVLLATLNNPTSITYAYQWQNFDGTNWVDIIGATSNQYTTPSLFNNTKYRIRYAQAGIDIDNNNNLNCSGSKETTIQITQHAKADDIQVESIYDICEGSETTITPSSNAGTNFYWYDGPTSEAILLSSSSSYSTGILDNSKTYYIAVSGDDYCENKPEDRKAVTANLILKPTPVTTIIDICFEASYSWPVNGETYNASGAYVKINDGCTANEILNLTVGTELTTSFTQTNVKCKGNSDGSVVITASGGKEPYSIPSTTGLNSGTHTFTITDDNGCTIEVEVNITEPETLSAVFTQTNVSCNGLSDGSVEINASGGTEPYGIPQTTGLNAGTHIFTITDAKGCTTDVEVNITEPETLSAVFTQTNVSCNGLSDGSVKITASGGTEPYDIPSTTGLNAGNYTFTVTDSNNCKTEVSVIITEPQVLSTVFTQINVSCNGLSDGSVKINASGGTAPYNIPSTTGLNAGRHTFTITDANGCTTDVDVIITEPLLLTAVSGKQVNVSCNGLSDGSVVITALGGTAPYTIPSTTGLNAGRHIFTITDTKGCTTDVQVNITQPAVLTAVSGKQVNVSCNGLSDGSVVITPSGGTAPYAIPSTTGLNAGSHTFTITDANGCTTDLQVNITQPAVLTAVSAKQVDVKCKGDATGSVLITPSGGTGPYIITPPQTGLTAGAYIFNVIDTQKCSTEVRVTITEPAMALKAVIQSQADVTCKGGADGSVLITPSGGTAPYDITPSQIGLAAGTHTFTLTDYNNCKTTIKATIAEPAMVLAATLKSQVNVKCKGDATGSVLITPSGGTAPYKITPQQTGLSAGVHTFTITDYNNCQTIIKATITEPAIALTASIKTQFNVECKGEAGGSVLIIPSGGTGPYLITPPQTGLMAGDYTFTVTDGNKCTTSVQVTITEPLLLQAKVLEPLLPEFCQGDKDGAFSIEISGGTIPYTYSLDSKKGPFVKAGPQQNIIDLTGLSAGSHMVYITDALGCTAQVSAILPDAVKLNPIVEISTECVQNATANRVSVKVDPSIDNPADVDYSLDGGTYQSGNVFTNLTPGKHTITARHSNGCTRTAKEFTIQYIAPLEVSIEDGELNQILATPNGGQGPYRYSFEAEPYTTENKFTIYKSGVYQVGITDKNGCTATVSRYFQYIDLCIPNHFTPNGDGINDQWGPGCSTSYKNLTFAIFDRHGRIIGNFKYGQKWDGKYNGNELSSGDYWYVFKLNDNKDNREFVGHFTLYR
ncbi:T9SS type B sorting domain-containing protein [[Flexibacter] sp. ATCC 35103]|uniref:T9SS type B sorting domain-containing protein n=1 Tax=[Flexibacter] sp. ATCC 35103 TaxID=1937528 RepID=UPI0009C84C72|nr:T9SS type B sorting domain-containing protein [[Flexibacter] sp. ATCC 35103]OMQ12439.1 hypothetical protein BXU01_06065 [[Flexibacter] sp. ATCC 35103]